MFTIPDLPERPGAVAAAGDVIEVGGPAGSGHIPATAEALGVSRHVLTFPGERFLVDKFAANPIFTAAAAGKATIYWPWVVRAREILGGAALGKFYLYFSTDHDAGAGGCFMAYADQLEGPWTLSAMNYTDTVVGDQTETPSVVWSPSDALFFMFYQQGGIGAFQATCLAQSADGITWTRYTGGKCSVGTNSTACVLDYFSATLFRGNGHTGYFKPQKLGGLWFGYHLTGGSDFPYFGLSWSKNGTAWALDPNELVYNNDLTTVDTRIEWNMAQVVHFRGRLWWCGLVSTYDSGGGGAVATPAMAPLSADLRTLIGQPVSLFAPSEPWEVEGVRSCFYGVDSGRMYLIYQYGNSFGIAYITPEI